MPRISKIANDTTLTDSDKLLGTDVSGATKNFTLEQLGNFTQTNYSNVDIANGANNRVITATDADSLNGEANLTFDGSTLTVIGGLTVGVNDTGHDVKFFGATSGRYLLWDESEDDLVFYHSGSSPAMSIGLGTNDLGGHNAQIGLDGYGSLEFRFDRSSADPNIVFDASTSGLRFNDNIPAVFGTDSDATIKVSSDDLIVENTANDKDIILKTDNGSGGTTAYITLDGSGNTVEVAKDTNFATSIKVAENLRRTITTVTPVDEAGNKLSTINLSLNDNFIVNLANQTNVLAMTIASENVGQSGVIILKNPSSVGSFAMAALPSNMLTPAGANVNFTTSASDTSVISYVVISSTQALVNFVGDFS